MHLSLEFVNMAEQPSSWHPETSDLNDKELSLSATWCLFCVYFWTLPSYSSLLCLVAAGADPSCFFVSGLSIDRQHVQVCFCFPLRLLHNKEVTTFVKKCFNNSLQLSLFTFNPFCVWEQPYTSKSFKCVLLPSFHIYCALPLSMWYNLVHFQHIPD